MMQKGLISSLILIVILIQPSSAQEKRSEPSLGWDLTYSSVLKRNNITRSDWIWKWLKLGNQERDTRDQSPAQKWLAEWQGEPIVSSILIESPAFHAAEHTTDWFVRTENKAFYWRMVEDHGNSEIEKQYFTLQAYDDLFREVSTWQQAVPRKAKELPPGMPSAEIKFNTSYIGFLSSYEKGKSRQMLLTMEDFVICNGKKCTPESRELKPGRVLNAQVNIPRDPRCWEKKYIPKSKTELAAMPARQLIEELVKSNTALFDSKEMLDYVSSIKIKIRKAGIEALPVLIEYMNAFEPQSDSECDELRFDVAQRIAEDIDQSGFRLRGTKEGQLAIDAFERSIERIEKTKVNKDVHYFDYLLKYLKGTNRVDNSIQDTFWVQRKIKISGSELLEFSNFLIAMDPTYPSWSDTDLIKDYSRINESGIPLQVYILKEPKRFYEAFTEFRKNHPQTAPF